MFSTIFGSVSRAFRSKSVRDEEVAQVLGTFRPVILGWHPCYYVNVNLLFPALVDFGLIHLKKIGVSWPSVRCSSREIQVQLSLRILDVNGSPIEYNCCDLELIDWRVLGSSGEGEEEEEHVYLEGGCCERKERLWNLCSDGMAKLQVKVVRRCDAFDNLRDCLSDSVLVRASGKQKGDLSDFLAYRFVQLLPTHYDYRSPEQLTVWETLLSLLYKQGCWALVSVDNGKGASCVAILRPFTDSLAFLHVLDDPLTQLAFDCDLVDDQFDMEDRHELSYAATEFNKSNESNFFKSCMKSATLSEKPNPDQICSLLEDCMEQRGFSGDRKLDYYAAKITKSRYSHSLQDVVNKIYNKMDLLWLFVDEDESPHYLPHSEDSNKSLNLKVCGNEMGENDVGNEPFTAGNEPFPLQENDSGVFQRIIEGDHNKKLVEAKEKRTERAHGFSSLTNRNTYLQRVWDPKQKGMKPKTE